MNEVMAYTHCLTDFGDECNQPHCTHATMHLESDKKVLFTCGRKDKLKRCYLQGPFGDESSNYRMEFPDGMTVLQFIESVMKQFPNEWGNFYAYPYKIIADYKDGKYWIINSEGFEKIKNEPITAVGANGGWSLMHYDMAVLPDKKAVPEVDINEKTEFPF